MLATQEMAIEQQSASAGSAEPQRSQTLQPAAATEQGATADQGSSKEPPTADEIAVAAYALYVAEGYQDGHDLEHWLEAERLLRSRRQD